MNVKIEATPQQFSALLGLLNKGMTAGAFNLDESPAVSFWAQKVHTAINDQKPAPETSEPE